MDIMTPNIIDVRARKWTDWWTYSEEDLKKTKRLLESKRDEIIESERYDSDMADVLGLAWNLHQKAVDNLRAIEWSAKDYRDLQQSTFFRIAMKIRSFFKK